MIFRRRRETLLLKLNTNNIQSAYTKPSNNTSYYNIRHVHADQQPSFRKENINRKFIIIYHITPQSERILSV